MNLKKNLWSRFFITVKFRVAMGHGAITGPRSQFLLGMFVFGIVENLHVSGF